MNSYKNYKYHLLPRIHISNGPLSPSEYLAETHLWATVLSAIQNYKISLLVDIISQVTITYVCWWHIIHIFIDVKGSFEVKKWERLKKRPKLPWKLAWVSSSCHFWDNKDKFSIDLMYITFSEQHFLTLTILGFYQFGLLAIIHSY